VQDHQRPARARRRRRGAHGRRGAAPGGAPARRHRGPPRRRRVRRAVRGPRGRPGRCPGGRAGAGRPRPARRLRRPGGRLLGQHPRRGLLAPAEFIQVAEDTGIVVPLGAWVLRQACRDLIQILDQGGLGGGPSDLVMSVNLSARQLNTPGLLPMVESVLGEHGLDPWRLCFEITESVLMDEVDLAISVLSDLRALGVRLAIDDFGTGYSSLGYLRRFPVDIVKLDRAFVAGLGSDSAADAIAAAVINLGHALGLSVIAEGVENDEQLTVLRALRCDRAQGYLWSAPQSPEALAEWMVAKPSGELELAPVDLPALVADRVATVRSAVRPSGSAPIVVQVPPTLASAFADAGAVSKVLDHLLANALKYSPGDRPVVVSAAADKRFVRISVADYGIGMTPD